MKLALSNCSFSGLSFEEQCEEIARSGAAGVLITPSTISPRGDALRLEPSHGEYLLETAKFHNLEIVGFENLLAGSEETASGPLRLTSSVPENRDNVGSYLQHLAQLCYAMEGKVIILGSSKERAFSSPDTLDEAATNAAAILRPLSNTLGEVGIQLAIDPRPYHETNFLNSARDALILQKLVDHPACQLQLNTSTLALELHPKTPRTPTPEGVTATEAQIAHYARELIHFHRESLIHFQFGDGTLDDFLPAALALREFNYQGWVSFQPAKEVNQTKESFSNLRQLVG